MNAEAQRNANGNANALPIGTRLREFEIRDVLGAGGFGIVYLAFDHSLEREVAIKEYMPSDLAGRTETMHVSIRSQSNAEIFKLGRESFVKEAKMLARFEHPSLLKVYHFWEDNGTAYMTMPVLRGQTVKALRRGMNQPPDEAWLRQLLEPLLGALETLHAKEIYHRDIAPDNIQVEPDGRPVLMDFGAARRLLGDRTQMVTTIVKPTYSPIEQFADSGAAKQGPWTDLYALGGTLHYLLMNRPPQPATARMVHDDDSALTTETLPGCSEEFLRIIDWMLAPHPNDRPQSVAILRDALAGRISVPLRRSHAKKVSGDWDQTIIMPPPGAKTVATVRGEAPVAATPTMPAAQPAYDDEAAVTIRVQRSDVGQVAKAPARPQPMPATHRPTSSKALPIGLGLGALLLVAGGAFWGLKGKPAPAVPEPVAIAVPAAQEPAPPASSPALASATPPVAELAASAPSTAPNPAPAVATAKPESAVAAVVVPALAKSEPVPAKPATAPPAKPLAIAKPTPQVRSATPEYASQSAPVTAPQPSEPQRKTPEPAVTQTVVPTPAQAPVKPVATNPEAVCGGRNPLLYFVCMEKECLRGEQTATADCKAWRKNARNPYD